jgi:hypothetical protein
MNRIKAMKKIQKTSADGRNDYQGQFVSFFPKRRDNEFIARGFALWIANAA